MRLPEWAYTRHDKEKLQAGLSKRDIRSLFRTVSIYYKEFFMLSFRRLRVLLIRAQHMNRRALLHALTLSIFRVHFSLS